MPGHWELVENKGYKLYFDDGSGAYEYTKYDVEKGEFYFTTNISTGIYGSPEVTFTYQDESFADVYDGIGLGRKPPVFNLYGYYGAILGWEGIITCNEDGTFIATARSERSETLQAHGHTTKRLIPIRLYVIPVFYGQTATK